MCGGCGNHSQKEKEMHSVHVAEDLFDRSRFPLKHADNNKSSSPPLEAISSNLKNFMLFTLIIHPFVCGFFFVLFFATYVSFFPSGERRKCSPTVLLLCAVLNSVPFKDGEMLSCV